LNIALEWGEKLKKRGKLVTCDVEQDGPALEQFDLRTHTHTHTTHTHTHTHTNTQTHKNQIHTHTHTHTNHKQNQRQNRSMYTSNNDVGQGSAID
jgi:hypothetical protein